MKSLTTRLYEARVGQTTITFETPMAMALFCAELLGQISDGKYENSRPQNHWEWVGNVTCELGDEPGYVGPTHRLRYNLDEWPGYIKKGGDWAFAGRVLTYGKLALAMDKAGVAPKSIDALEFESVVCFAEIMEEEQFTDTKAIDEWAEQQMKEQYPRFDAKQWNAGKYKKYITDDVVKNFTELTYTERDLKADLQDMKEAVNTQK